MYRNIETEEIHEGLLFATEYHVSIIITMVKFLYQNYYISLLCIISSVV